MNLTGLSNINKEMASIRSPSNSKTDVLKRLVFIYPCGIDQSLANIPLSTFTKGDADNLSDALRAFLSISVLKEIFVSNTLNLVSLAASYERQKKVSNESTALINKLIRGDKDQSAMWGGWSNTPERYKMIDDYNTDVNTLQKKINLKFDKIKRSIQTDHRLKKLLPFMQVITLQNMLDVPIITGTYPFQFNTETLFMFLSMAIMMRTKISEWSAVQKVFQKMKTLPDKTLYQIGTILNNTKEESSVPNEISTNELPGSKSSEVDEIQKEISDTESNFYKNRLLKKLDSIKKNFSSQNVYLLKENKIEDLERMFRYMVDTKRIMMKFGYSYDVSQASYVGTKITPQTEMMFQRIKQQFIDFLSGIDNIYTSTYMLFSPIVSTDPNWNTSSLNMKRDFINYFYDNFSEFMSQVQQEFQTLIDAKTESTYSSLEKIKSNCSTVNEDFISTLNFINKKLNDNQISSSFSINDVEKFANAIDDLITSLITSKHNLQNELSSYFNSNFSDKINSKLSALIDSGFVEYFDKFNQTRDPESQLQARLFTLDLDYDGIPPQEQINRKKRLHAEILSGISQATKLILETVFLLIFKINLCDYVDIVDVEFNIAKNDVLDLPNYCLILPLEIINALYIIYTKRNWQEAVLKSGSNFNPLNVGNIKGVIRLLRLQLGIPNLFVVDNRKKEIYYSFQYLDNAVEKIKMNALDIFIKHHLKEEESGVSQVFY